MKLQRLATVGATAAVFTVSLLGGTTMASAAPVQSAPAASSTQTVSASTFKVNELDGTKKLDFGLGYAFGGSGTPGSTVQIVDAQGQTISTSTVTRFGSWFANAKNLPDGELAVTFRQTDAQGIAVEVSRTFQVKKLTQEQLDNLDAYENIGDFFA